MEFRYLQYVLCSFFTVRTTHRMFPLERFLFGYRTSVRTNFINKLCHPQIISSRPLSGVYYGMVVLSGIVHSIWKLLSLSNLISTSYLFLKARNCSDITSSKQQSTSLLGSKECQPVCYFNCCHEIKLQWSILSSHLFRSSA